MLASRHFLLSNTCYYPHHQLAIGIVGVVPPKFLPARYVILPRILPLPLIRKTDKEAYVLTQQLSTRSRYLSAPISIE